MSNTKVKQYETALDCSHFLLFYNWKLLNATIELKSLSQKSTVSETNSAG